MATTSTPASGSIFPLGTTNVVATATNAAGSTGSNGFNVTVRDTTPPAITVPANLSTNATTATGAYVSFTTSASDLVSGSVPVTNTPTSGSFFPIGTNNVTATSTDAAGNAASRMFSVTVVVPPVAASERSAPSLGLSGSNLSVTIHASVPGRTYQLQRCDDLTAGNWQNVGSAQTGSGGDIVLPDTYDAVVLQRFYRVLLGP